MTEVRRCFVGLARTLVVASLGVPLAALGGCGMSSLTSGLGGGMFGGGSSQTSQASTVSEDQLLDAAKASDPNATGSTIVGEIDAGCPRLTIAPHDNYITFYQQGHVGDALSVAQRGEITKTARECQIEPGRVTVRYGFSGRVLLGPRGKAGNVTLPVNIVVTDTKREKIASDTVSVAAAVAVDNPIGYFSTVRSLTFTIPEGTRPGEFEVFVGFDQNAQGAG
jgi:hypothetical protein